MPKSFTKSLRQIFLKGQAVGMHKCGKSERWIAQELHIPASTVHLWITLFRQRGSLIRKEGSGRTNVTTPRSDRHLVRIAKQSRFSPTSLLLQTWGEPVSRWTVSRRLRDAGLRCYRPAIRPLLTEMHKQLREQWAMNRSLWRNQIWDRIVWTD